MMRNIGHLDGKKRPLPLDGTAAPEDLEAEGWTALATDDFLRSGEADSSPDAPAFYAAVVPLRLLKWAAGLARRMAERPAGSAAPCAVSFDAQGLGCMAFCADAAPEGFRSLPVMSGGNGLPACRAGRACIAGIRAAGAWRVPSVVEISASGVRIADEADWAGAPEHLSIEMAPEEAMKIYEAGAHGAGGGAWA